MSIIENAEKHTGELLSLMEQFDQQRVGVEDVGALWERTFYDALERSCQLVSKLSKGKSLTADERFARLMLETAIEACTLPPTGVHPEDDVNLLGNL